MPQLFTAGLVRWEMTHPCFTSVSVGVLTITTMEMSDGSLRSIELSFALSAMPEHGLRA
jgi:hypothetical protein